MSSARPPLRVFWCCFLLVALPAIAREFVTERPDKARAAYTLDRGRFAIEPEFVNYSVQSEDQMNTFVFGEIFFRYGLTTNLEVQVNTDSFVRESLKKDVRREKAKGLGNTELALKYNLVGNDDGDWALAIIPYVFAPTASGGVWDERWEGGVAFATEARLQGEWVMGLTVEPNNVRKDRDLDWQSSLITSLSFSHPIFWNKLHGFIEIFHDEERNEEEPEITTLDVAIQYEVSKDVRFDVGTYIGLNPDANDLESFAGASYLF